MGVLRFLALLSLAIFAAELAIMVALNYLPIEPGLSQNLLDAAMLVLVLFPILYFFVVRNSKVVQTRLETQVEERTSSLVGMNRALERSIARLDQRRREVVLLGDTGNLFQACQGIDEATAVAETQLSRLFPGLSGALFLMNASRDTMQQAAGWGPAVPKVRGLSPDGCWALRRGKPHLVEGQNEALACDCIRSVDRSWYVCLPLIAAGAALGSLCLVAPKGQDGPEESDGDRMDFYVAVAETLSLAIANLRLRETLRYQALRDPLTGLFNRRYLLDAFDHELSRAASRAQPLSIIMFDIDHFKRFNDAFGHAAGDTVLAQLGKLLQEWARGEDILVRYGGEEFTVVLPDTSPESALARAESLRQAVAALTLEHHGERLTQVTISAGIASYPLHGSDRESLVRLADQALYSSKSAGRNRVSLASVALAEGTEVRLPG